MKLEGNNELVRAAAGARATEAYTYPRLFSESTTTHEVPIIVLHGRCARHSLLLKPGPDECNVKCNPPCNVTRIVCVDGTMSMCNAREAFGLDLSAVGFSREHKGARSAYLDVRDVE